MPRKHKKNEMTKTIQNLKIEFNKNIEENE